MAGDDIDADADPFAGLPKFGVRKPLPAGPVDPATGAVLPGARAVPAPPGEDADPLAPAVAFGRKLAGSVYGTPEQAPFAERFRDWVTRVGTGKGAMETDKENLPELRERLDDFADVPGARTRLHLGYMVAGLDSNQLRGIVQSTLGPKATIMDDRFGNPIVTYNGKSYYLNKPGVSEADIYGAVAPLAIGGGAAAAFGKVASAIGAGETLMPAGARLAGGPGPLNTAIRSVLQGTGQGGASLAGDLAAKALGSGENPDPWKALTAAGVGAVAEPLTQVAVGAGRWIGRKIGEAGGAAARSLESRLPQLSSDWQDFFGRRGRLTAEPSPPPGPGDARPLTAADLNSTGRLLLQRGGFQPEDFTVGTMRDFQGGVGRTAQDLLSEPTRLSDPLTVARFGQAVRDDVRLSLGQATGNPGQLSAEERLRTSAGGQGRAAEFRAGQLADIENRATALIPGGAPGTTPTQVSIGGGIIQAVRDRHAALRTAEQQAYARLPPMVEDAMARGGPALWYGSDVSNNALAALHQLGAERRFGAGWETAGTIRQMIADRLSQPGANALAAITSSRPWQPIAGARPINLAGVDSLLADVGDAIRTAKNWNPGEREYALQMQARLRQAVDNANTGTAGTVSGDRSLIPLWQDAQARSRERFAFLGDSNLAQPEELMKAIRDGKVSATQVTDAVLQGYGGAQSHQIIDHFINQFPGGAQSNAVQMLRQAFAREVMLGPRETATGDLVPGQLASRLANFLDGHGQETARMLFTPAELRDMQGFRETVLATIKGNSKNPSGTGQDLAGRLAAKIKSIPILRGIMEAAAGSPEAAAMRAYGATGGGARLMPGDMMASLDDPAAIVIKRLVAPATGLLVERAGSGPPYQPDENR